MPTTSCSSSARASNKPPHLAGVSLQRCGDDGAARGGFRHLNHRGADILVFTAPGITKADHLNAFVLLEHRIRPPVAGDIGAGCAEHGGGRLGAAGGEEQKGEEDAHGGSVHGHG